MINIGGNCWPNAAGCGIVEFLAPVHSAPVPESGALSSAPVFRPTKPRVVYGARSNPAAIGTCNWRLNRQVHFTTMPRHFACAGRSWGARHPSSPGGWKPQPDIRLPNRSETNNEKDFSAQRNQAQAHPRIPCAHGNQERSRRPCPSSGPGSQASGRLRPAPSHS